MVDGDYFLKTQTKRKTGFPSPPHKYIRGRSQSSSIYLDDFIPLKSDDASTISPVSLSFDCEEKDYSGRALKRPNSLRLVCSYESSTIISNFPAEVEDISSIVVKYMNDCNIWRSMPASLTKEN